jgi:hypothetical protein
MASVVVPVVLAWVVAMVPTADITEHRRQSAECHKRKIL